MEATALSVGKSALDGALGYAKSVFAEEVALQLGVQRDHDFIRDELAMMQAFLMAAHEERDDHLVVKTWVKQVRDVAYDAEDSLQDFAVRLGKPSWWCFPRTLLDRRRVAARMKALRAKVEDVSQRNVRYQLIRSSSGSTKPSGTTAEQSDKVSTVMSSTEEAMRQRNKAKIDLIRLIYHHKNEENLRVIALWGTRGALGLKEASIVKMAYDYLKRGCKFECQAWANITRPFKRVEFVQNIVRQLCVDSLHDTARPKAQDLWEAGTILQEAHLIGAFQKYVNDKRFLIVIGNLFSMEEWDQIRECFSDNKKGSRLIVCSKKVEVARLCVRKETEMLEHKQLFTDPTLFAFYNKGSQDGTCSMETGLSSSEITDNGSAEEKKFTRMETISYALKESHLIGREKEKSDIISLTCCNSREVQVISIWGKGLVGKTSLVKQVYQSQVLCHMFKKHAFATIRHPFKLDELLHSLATQLLTDWETRHGMSLRDSLEGKTYLIVLDGLYSTTVWDAIKKYFPRSEGRSQIIVTTNDKRIAEYCSNNEEYTVELGLLGEKDAYDLFTKKVFGKMIDLDEQYVELAEVANMILKKCNGFPLAIVTIAGFLSKQPKTLMEWKRLNEYIGVDPLEMNPEHAIIKDVLMKSYDGLPYHLKSCFLYMSIFPEDHKISRRRLVRRWVAEGYSSDIHKKSAEEICDSYFMSLMDRSMILPSKNSFDSIREIDSCELHDLMREISISKSIDENLVLRLDGSCSSSSNKQKIVRHLTISEDWMGDRSEFESAVDMSRIRSLTVFGEWRSFYISKKMRLLRVLDLENTKGLLDHHLEHIGSLVHLKYISLRGCRGIYHLPGSWGKLLQLETLDVKGTRICVLPPTIIKLWKLQHLYGGELEPLCVYPNKRIPGELMELCLACCAPKYLKNVESLGGNLNMHDVCTFWGHVIFPTLSSRRLDPCGILLPKGVKKLKNLRTLGLVNIRGGKAILREIRRLTHLRKLAVRGINKKNCQEFCSTVAELTHLESLLVESAPGSSLHGLSDEASTIPSNLQSLKLRGRLVKLPEWIGGLQNLVKLVLWDTMLSEVDSTMKALGELPNLAILQLLGIPFNFDHGGVRVTFCREVPFRSLMVLKLACVYGLRSVEFQEAAAPKLELLRFDGLSDSPANLFSGLATLQNLKEFEQHNRTYSFEKDVQEQLAKHPNRPIFKKLNRR